MYVRKKTPAPKKEVPAWKLALEGDEAQASSVLPVKRARDEARDEDLPSSNLVISSGGAAGASSSAETIIGRDDDGGAVIDDDDDDDDDVDLSAYDLGGGKDNEEEEAVTAAPAYQPSAEELLLLREARDSAGKSTRTYYVDDALRSMEKSAGAERKRDAMAARAAFRNIAPSGVSRVGGGFDAQSVLDDAARSIQGGSRCTGS